ncbi:MAG TPA: bifunctional oligoribonuclease/PAP phosphatase NrnA [Actinomycetota bacterium]|nr:bifunctional oligoribonuclease/PAP phosphatase NrnA [Actinomycetota bacterium]
MARIPGWEGAVEALARSDEVIVACHVNPDGDGLGSVLAMALALERLGKRVHRTWGEEGASRRGLYAFLPGADAVKEPSGAPRGVTLLALDCGAADRLGTLEPLIDKSDVVINVDHHPRNDCFGTYNLVVTDASSTAEICSDLIADLGVELDKDIATCLYAGVVTDTGRFQFSNTTPRTHELAARLLACGVVVPEIAQAVFETAPFGSLKLLGRVLQRARLEPDVRLVHSFMRQQDLEETGVDPDETDGFIESLRSTRDADVIAFFKEQRDGRYRVSLRSRGAVSVGAMARARGGGGHELAAGFTARDYEDCVEDLVSELRRVRRGEGE